jgi:mono/diheme cytochrome c family protein
MNTRPASISGPEEIAKAVTARTWRRRGAADPFGKLVAPTSRGQGYQHQQLQRRRFKAHDQGYRAGRQAALSGDAHPYYAHLDDLPSYGTCGLSAHRQAGEEKRHRQPAAIPLQSSHRMLGWNALFFAPKPIVPTAAKSNDWNRGAYLVNGPAHCGACHAPKNMFGADKSTALTGTSLQGWFASDLTGDRNAGLGAWSAADIAEYLGTGRNSHSIASGPMAEVVENSTADDRRRSRAIAVYLWDLPLSRGVAAAPPVWTRR